MSLRYNEANSLFGIVLANATEAERSGVIVFAIFIQQTQMINAPTKNGGLERDRS